MQPLDLIGGQPVGEDAHQAVQSSGEVFEIHRVIHSGHVTSAALGRGVRVLSPDLAYVVTTYFARLPVQHTVAAVNRSHMATVHSSAAVIVVSMARPSRYS